MDADHDRRQYLIGSSAGITALVLSLLVYITEETLVREDWIPERTINSFLYMYFAILCLYGASLSHAKMLVASKATPDEQPEPPHGEQAEPLDPRRLRTTAVLLSLAIGVMIEVFFVLGEALHHRDATQP